MKKDLVEMVFILDRSGSMVGLEKDTIGGFNGMIQKQKEVPGKALVTTILFDDKYEVVHNREALENVNKMTSKEYFVRGNTALLDAIGKSINNIINAHENLLQEEMPEKTLFVVITDGMENSSIEFDYKTIKSMIEKQKTECGWEFVFLGANIDAVETARDFGIDAKHAANYHSDSKGTKLNYQILSETIASLRKNKEIDNDWKDKIEKDFDERK